ncbi:GNAT family acetyltransferase [bacterium]|nr:GNAT family acetyltransferase [bacterium]
MQIRPYQDTDRDAVVRLWELCGLTVPWNDPAKDIARKRTVQSELFLVGVDGTEVVASAMGGYDGHRGWVNYLAVNPDHRHRGLGRQMMAALEQLLLERGCPKLNLQVRETNRAAIEFYERVGYKVDAVVSMGKRLIPDQ